MARFRYVITLFLAFMSMAGAGPAKAQAPEKLPVVATFSILADFAPRSAPFDLLNCLRFLHRMCYKL